MATSQPESVDSTAIAVRADGPAGPGPLPVVGPFRSTAMSVKGEHGLGVKPAGRITSMASRLQEQLSQFAASLAQTDAVILAGHDECSRINDEHRQMNLDFSHNVMKMAGEQTSIVETSKTRIETQRSTLRAVHAERDELVAEKDTLTKTVGEQKQTIQEQGHELEVAREARRILEQEIQAKDAELEQTEKEVSALHEENARLVAELENREASVEEAVTRKHDLHDRNNDLLAQLGAAETARVEAEDNIQRLMAANAALEEEIAQGEAAVMALQNQTAESFASLSVDREQLVARNRALAQQMIESQERLDAVRAEAEAIIREEQERNEELERRHEEVLAEVEGLGGAASIRPMLVAAQEELRAEKARVAALANKNAELEAAAAAEADAAAKAGRDVVPVAEMVRAKKEAEVEIEKLRVSAAAAEARAKRLEEAMAEMEARGAALTGQKGVLEGKLELINRSLADFEKVHAETMAHREAGAGSEEAGGSSPSSERPWRDLDLQSVAGYSDLASNISEIPNPNDVEARASRAAKARANKVKFEQMKAQRNQYKNGLRAAQHEIEKMKAEIAAVEALKEQVRLLQEATFL